MAIKIQFDSANNPVQPRLILTTRNGDRIHEIPMNEIKFREGLNSGSEFSFIVYKERCVDKTGEIDEDFWSKLTDLKLAWSPEFDQYYELSMDLTESTATSKNVVATSLGEAELSQSNVYGLEINTEDDIDRGDYVPTVFFDAEHPESSLVDRLLYKVPHYRIDHVDDSLMDIQRTFQFNGTSVYDAFQQVAQECDCLFKFECVPGDDGGIDRKVSAYDLEYSCSCGWRADEPHSVCPKCHRETVVKPYGEDTTIYVAKENLAQEITYTTDIGSVKNCFRLEAGDDLMTATVINCNPNGSQYIWYITDEMREDMSDALKAKLELYDNQYDYYQEEAVYEPPSNLLEARASADQVRPLRYNEIVAKYQSFKPELEEIPASIVGYSALMEAYYNTIDMQLFLNSELMPNVNIESTDAATEAAKLTSASIGAVAVANLDACSASTAANAVLAMAKCIVRGTYELKIHDSSYSGHTWTGTIDVTNYGDEEDTATTSSLSITINGDMETYIKQKLKRAMHQQSDEVTDISELFELEGTYFENELKKWSLQRLLAFRDACQACLDILIQQGAATPSNWVSEQNSVYDNLYLPYLDKQSAIEAEIEVRSEELAMVSGIYDENGNILFRGLQNVIVDRRNEIQAVQNFENFLGTELWNEFAAYRREDTYNNPNYISDGLNNEELFSMARQFLSVAQNEIYKSSTLQHSISASLNDLLTMKEFKPLVNKFQVGNWIRVRVDGKVYRLRLSEYSIDYNNWGLEVQFTDVKFGHSSVNDIQSILDAAKSISSSYGAVTRQAEDGRQSYNRMKNWVQEGFSLTTKLVGGAENQEMVIDSTGITGREWLAEQNDYSPQQMKLINTGLYLTDDGWLTSKAAIGKFQYWNPVGGPTHTGAYEEAYGVIADKLVGSMILGQNIGCYTENGSVTLDENGFTLITEAGDGAKVFNIMRREQNGDLVNVLSLDQNGHLKLETNGIEEAVQTAIEINERGLMTQVQNILTEDRTVFEQRTDSLALQVEQNREDIGVVQTTFRVTIDGAEISKNTSDTILKLENDQIVIEVNGQPVTYWNINEQYMPKMVNIPVGGSLRLGQIQFQPRSSGNLSLLWVG